MSDTERLQFNALLEARAHASGLDLSNVSDETRDRVAAMLKHRRERMIEEEREYLESIRQGEAEKGFAREIAGTMETDEKTARLIVLRQEEKAFERIVRVFDEQFQRLSAGMLTLRQQKEIEASRGKKLHSLERELNKQRFYLYWDNHEQQRHENVRSVAAAANALGLSSSSSGGGGGGSGSGGSPSSSSKVDFNSPEAQMHRMTAVLRRAYEKSAPAFATDPEELWKRGQALPPTAAASSTSAFGEVELPAYHDMGAKIREKYARHAAKNGVGASIGVSVNPVATTTKQRYKSSASYPYQQDSPFATAVAKTLHDFSS